MKLTSKGRYAVTAMLDLALHTEQGPVNLADISLRQGISLSYLEQLFAKLRKSGLVKSVRGPGGGYQLNLAADAVSIAAVIAAVDESVEVTKCNRQGNCQGGQVCLSHHLWADLSEQIYGFLRGITLAQVVSRKDVRDVAERQDDRLRGHAAIEGLITLSVADL